MEDPKDFKKFEAIFKNLMSKFDDKQQEFEELKKMDDLKLHEYNKEVKLTNLSSDWSKALEMYVPDCNDGKHDHESLMAEFMETKKQEFQKVEQFIQILNDWIKDAVHRVENVVLAPKAPKTPKNRPKIEIPEEETAEPSTNYPLYGAIAVAALAAGVIAFKHVNKN